MHRELAPVIRFVRQHHRRQWSVTGFVGAIDAVLRFAPIEGGRIPGVSMHSGKTLVIGLDEGIVGTPWYVPVLAHEITHLLLESSGIWLCAPFGSKSRVVESWASATERNAWFGAALLAVSRQHIAGFKQGRSGPEDIATECMVPVQFVDFAYAVHTLIEAEMPLNLRAANLAYERWQGYMTSTMRKR